MRCAIFVLLLSLTAAAQDSKTRDEVLQLKDGGLKTGKITKLDETGLEIVPSGESKALRIEFKEIQPYSLYELKRRRIDPEKGPAHFELGEFLASTGYFGQAIREFEEAAAKDKDLAERCRKKIDESRLEDARTKYEEAKRLSLEKKYERAQELLRTILDKYSETPYFEEAKKLVVQIADLVQKENEDKRRQLEEKKKAEEAKSARSKEDLEKLALNQSIEASEEAQKAWTEGLEWEGKGNLTKADRAWKAAEARLLTAKKNTELLVKSNDVEMIKKAKELDRQLDAWLAKTYYRLGRMWAVELAYPTALEHLNKALKIPHDDAMDHVINEVLLTITQAEMRRRATKGGY